MSNRLNQDREAKLQPLRMRHAIEEIEKLGYGITMQGATVLQFHYKGKVISYWPYSGWASGATIKDGRGLQNLLKQITP